MVIDTINLTGMTSHLSWSKNKGIEWFLRKPAFSGTTLFHCENSWLDLATIRKYSHIDFIISSHEFTESILVLNSCIYCQKCQTNYGRWNIWWGRLVSPSFHHTLPLPAPTTLKQIIERRLGGDILFAISISIIWDRNPLLSRYIWLL